MGSVRAQQVTRRAEKSKERLRILLAGDATTGKTTSLETLPDALRAVGVESPRIVVLDLDQNADNLIDREGFEVYRWGGVPGSDHEAADACEWWMREELTKMEGIHVVVGDSLTALSMMALAHVTNVNNRFGKAPQLQDWNHEMNTTQNFCLKLQNIKVSHAVITTCHTHLEKDDLSGRAYNALVLTGKLPKKLVRFFPEIYYANVQGLGNKAKFMWRTTPEQGTIARTQIPEFRKGEGVVQDFGPIFKAWFKSKEGSDVK